jgi:hypothetical protein
VAPCMRDQPVARPLLTHRTIQLLNKNICTLVRIETMTPVLEQFPWAFYNTYPILVRAEYDLRFSQLRRITSPGILNRVFRIQTNLLDEYATSNFRVKISLNNNMAGEIIKLYLCLMTSIRRHKSVWVNGNIAPSFLNKASYLV